LCTPFHWMHSYINLYTIWSTEKIRIVNKSDFPCLKSTIIFSHNIKTNIYFKSHISLCLRTTDRLNCFTPLQRVKIYCIWHFGLPPALFSCIQHFMYMQIASSLWNHLQSYISLFTEQIVIMADFPLKPEQISMHNYSF
jgi:hypothetical protein